MMMMMMISVKHNKKNSDKHGGGGDDDDAYKVKWLGAHMQIVTAFNIEIKFGELIGRNDC